MLSSHCRSAELCPSIFCCSQPWTVFNRCESAIINWNLFLFSSYLHSNILSNISFRRGYYFVEHFGEHFECGGHLHHFCNDFDTSTRFVKGFRYFGKFFTVFLDFFFDISQLSDRETMDTILRKITRFAEFSDLYISKPNYLAAIAETAEYTRYKNQKTNNDKAQWYELVTFTRLKFDLFQSEIVSIEIFPCQIV